MKLDGKRIDLHLLADEAAAAGVAVGDLGTAGDDLVTWDDDGHTIDVPAALGAVLAAHVAPPPARPLVEQLVAALVAADTFDEAKPILAALLRGAGA